MREQLCEVELLLILLNVRQPAMGIYSCEASHALLCSYVARYFVWVSNMAAASFAMYISLSCSQRKAFK